MHWKLQDASESKPEVDFSLTGPGRERGLLQRSVGRQVYRGDWSQFTHMVGCSLMYVVGVTFPLIASAVRGDALEFKHCSYAKIFYF